MGVRGDRHARLVVGRGDRAHHAFDARGHAVLVDGALEHARPDPGAGDALGDVAREHIHHGVGHLGAERLVQRGAAVVEEKRHAVVGVQAGGDDDVELGHLLGDPLDPRQVTAQADHGRVDDRADALGGQRAQLGHRVRDPFVLAAPLARVVLLDVRGEHEDVLMHVGRPEVGDLHRAADGRDLAHSARNSLSIIFPAGPLEE